MVQEGEGNFESAVRELEEEMGIKEVELRFHQQFLYTDEEVRAWGNMYSCLYDGYGFRCIKHSEVVWQKEEIDSIEMWSREDVLEKEKAGVKITPDSLFAFKILCEKWLAL